jgi:hypothetical protein
MNLPAIRSRSAPSLAHAQRRWQRVGRARKLLDLLTSRKRGAS